MREHSSHDDTTYGRFLHDLRAAAEGLRSKVGAALMRPDTAMAMGFTQQEVEDVMSGKVTDHPMLRRERLSGGWTLRVGPNP